MDKKTKLVSSKERHVILGPDAYESSFFLVFNTATLKFDEITVPEHIHFYDSAQSVFIGRDKLFICGGIVGFMVRSTCCYEYDFTTGEFRVLPDMPLGKSNSALYYDSDTEQVFCVGGKAYDKERKRRFVTKKCQVFDYRTKQWSRIGSLNKARSHNFVFEYRGDIWTIGGLNRSGRAVPVVEKYISKDDEWQIVDFEVPCFYTIKGILPTPQSNELLLFLVSRNKKAKKQIWRLNLREKSVLFHNFLEDDDDINLFISPVDQDSYLIFQHSDYTEYWHYDIYKGCITSDSWHQREEIESVIDLAHCSRKSLKVEFSDSEDKHMDAGDYRDTNVIIGINNQPCQIDISNKTGAVEIKALSLNFPIGTQQGRCRVSHNEILVCGGYNCFSDDPSLTDAWIFNLSTNVSTKIDHMLRDRCSSDVVYHKGCAYILGRTLFFGWNNQFFAYVERLDLQTLKWEDMGNLARIVEDARGISYGDNLYVAGYTMDGIATVEKYNEKRKRWEVTASLPTFFIKHCVEMAQLYGVVIFSSLQRKNKSMYALDVDKGDLAELRIVPPDLRYLSEGLCCFAYKDAVVVYNRSTTRQSLLFFAEDMVGDDKAIKEEVRDGARDLVDKWDEEGEVLNLRMDLLQLKSFLPFGHKQTHTSE